MSYFIKFRANSSAHDKLMPVNTQTKQEAVELARKRYGLSVDRVIGRNEAVVVFATIPFGSVVTYYTDSGEVIATYPTVAPKEPTEPVESILNWFKKANPVPDNKSIAVQIGCHIEEFREMLKSLQWVDEEKINAAYTQLTEVETLFKSLGSSPKTIDFQSMNQEQKVELLDSLADQTVTATGIAYRMGFKFKEALNEVSASNWSKFENGEPVRDSNGKILKGKNYFKPNLNQFV